MLLATTGPERGATFAGVELLVSRHQLADALMKRDPSSAAGFVAGFKCAAASPDEDIKFELGLPVAPLAGASGGGARAVFYCIKLKQQDQFTANGETIYGTFLLPAKFVIQQCRFASTQRPVWQFSNEVRGARAAAPVRVRVFAVSRHALQPLSPTPRPPPAPQVHIDTGDDGLTCFVWSVTSSRDWGVLVDEQTMDELEKGHLLGWCVESFCGAAHTSHFTRVATTGTSSSLRTTFSSSSAADWCCSRTRRACRT